MKTIEEKAKAYDNLIERLKDLKFAYRFSPLSDTIEEIFPDLTESEDEKIRKSIIAIINNYVDNSNTFKPKMIDWLEKQGESYTKKDVDNAYIEGIAFAKDELEKQGEQSKTLQTDDVPNESSTAAPLRTGAIGFDGEPMESKPCELKPAWSKRDELILKDVIKCIERIYRDYCYNKEVYPCLYHNTYEMKEWLKSLKERVLPQPEQEWSQEDAKALNRISTILVDASKVKNWWKEYRLIERDEMIRLTDFLKSLKDRYTWKPSDEHIHWLKWAINRMPDTEKANEAEAVLEDLLEQLKKLREK